MTKEYIVTEAQRIEIINVLDRLPGTRAVANFFEQALPQQVVHAKSEPEAAKCAEGKAKGKK